MQNDAGEYVDMYIPRKWYVGASDCLDALLYNSWLQAAFALFQVLDKCVIFCSAETVGLQHSGWDKICIAWHWSHQKCPNLHF